ncbi:MAG TPA: rhomboid family intramembrane serine protease [Cyclobacteriaceae bacterium]|nr:rhomboid family intramembrane serine protease [Cyclobacteriaceae bacterium]HMV07305.1 rhomboid family intramembrane serine protease [Cyclobacteriaceae bacterium]HMV89243.1 rhomboid family intramembrane serine protease [Cyclobacteriaceae bacterium]HMW99340.1 rhomboid family intramembrane serine protease [Cyclobacteriaceae bacterium]HMX48871.1 rhomboid family intramembrane serine protease [Cyclobacteriaceae bacterium]
MFNDFKSAFQRHNNAHAQLIIINVVIFVALGLLFVVAKISQQQAIFQVVYDQFVLPSQISQFLSKPWTILTYAFAHIYNYEYQVIGVWHILMNMLVFYWFAKLFVEYLGSDKLVALYVLGGLSGGLLYLLLYNTVPYFMSRPSDLVGASAAVFAVVVATATLLPDYTFFLLFLGPVRIKYIAAFYIVVSFISSVGDNAGGEVAHLGGALIGFIYIKQLQSGVNWGGWITVTLDWFKDLFKSKPAVKVTYRKEEKRAGTKSSPSGKASQAEIDAILDKISDRGYESLSKEEKEKLFNASKK